jgi:peptidoglycan/xylan/chitin deacetylase (PgdA/CDA1 family)
MEPGMFVTSATFELHMQLVKKYFCPVQLSDWVDGTAKREHSDARMIAITFDDGWIDFHELAFPILRKYQCPATVFVMPDMLEGVGLLWSSRLEQIYDNDSGRKLLADDRTGFLEKIGASPLRKPEDGADYEELASIIRSAKGLEDGDIELELSKIEMLLESDCYEDCSTGMYEFMTWKHLDDISKSGLVQFGSHTKSHRRLGTTTDQRELEEQIVSAKTILSGRLNEAYVDVFCYPNGDRSTISEFVVRNSHAAACSVERGLNSVDSDPYSINRVCLHDDISRSRTKFLARLAQF